MNINHLMQTLIFNYTKCCVNDHILYIQAIVFFYGYPDDVQRNTKNAEPVSRQRKYISTDILLDGVMIPTISKENLPLNLSNKFG